MGEPLRDCRTIVGNLPIVPVAKEPIESSQASENTGSMTGLVTFSSTSTEEISAMKQQIEILRKENEDIQNQMRILVDSSVSLMEDIKAAKIAKEQAIAVKEEFFRSMPGKLRVKDLMANLEKAIEEKEERIQHISKECESLQKTLESKQTEIKVIQTLLDDTEQQRVSFKRIISLQGTELDAAETEVARLSKLVESLTSKVLSLEKENNTLKEDIEGRGWAQETAIYMIERKCLDENKDLKSKLEAEIEAERRLSDRLLSNVEELAQRNGELEEKVDKLTVETFHQNSEIDFLSEELDNQREKTRAERKKRLAADRQPPREEILPVTSSDRKSSKSSGDKRSRQLTQ